MLISEAVADAIGLDKLDIGQEFHTTFSGHDFNSIVYELKGFKGMDMQLELQQSIEVLLKDDVKFAETFYQKVFDIAPEARGLFKKDMKAQGRLLTHMLTSIVHSLSRPEFLQTGLR